MRGLCLMYHAETTLRCDHCGRTLSRPGAANGEAEPALPLPPGWEAFYIPGWVGKFHACSPEHKAELIAFWGTDP